MWQHRHARQQPFAQRLVGIERDPETGCAARLGVKWPVALSGGAARMANREAGEIRSTRRAALMREASTVSSNG